jgi:hypothetical protein
LKYNTKFRIFNDKFTCFSSAFFICCGAGAKPNKLENKIMIGISRMVFVVVDNLKKNETY